MLSCSNDHTSQQNAARLAWWLADGAGFSVAELAHALHVSRRYVLRLLRAVRGCAHVEQDAAGRYCLGSRYTMPPTTGRERAFVLAVWLQGGERLRGVDVQRRLDLAQSSSAYRLLGNLACVLPILPDDTGRWGRCD